jgi:hypothetical protein
MTVNIHRDRGRDQIYQAISAKDRRRRAERKAVAGVQATAPPPRNDLLPNIPKVLKRTEDLKLAKRMVRKADEGQIARVTVSMQQFGFVIPLLVDKQDHIIDGHIRWEAARRMGLTEIPCLVVDHLSDTELKALKITLNRTAETGVWDFDALQLDLIELQAEDFTLEVTGFTTPEIDGLITEEEPPPEREEVQAPEGHSRVAPWSRSRLGAPRAPCARPQSAFRQIRLGAWRRPSRFGPAPHGSGSPPCRLP